MILSVAAATFGLIFLAELPDKTMFVSLVLSAQGRPLAVWLGAMAAFGAQVAIAVTLGALVLDVLPHTAVQALVASLFLIGAAVSFRARNYSDEQADIALSRSSVRTFGLAALIVFLAEWGDLTQIVIIDLAARYHSSLSVATGAITALAVVSALAVTAGNQVLRHVPTRLLRILTAGVLLALGLAVGISAALG